VAYIRFASVYGRFQGITDFVETLNHLKTDSPSPWETDNDALIEEDSTAMLTS
jgi:transcriptional repressor NrdR